MFSETRVLKLLFDCTSMLLKEIELFIVLIRATVKNERRICYVEVRFN